MKTTGILIAVLLLALAGCMKKDSGEKPGDVDYYTCTMHPSVHSKIPGKCPICSMDLVPVIKNGSDGAHDPQTREFVVPVERQQQIGVSYARVKRGPLRRTIRAAGTVQPDVSRDWRLVAHVDGYVRRLNVTSPGELVEKDAPLMSIYSPDLLTTERELVQLTTMHEAPAPLVEAAERRLRQWNVTSEQIAALERSGRANDELALLSPFRGVVRTEPVRQGENVKTGDLLVEVADLSVVWVWAEFYESEVSAIKLGQKAAVTSYSYPNEKFTGRITLINPFLDETTRTTKARIEIPNPDFKLRPGMYASVELGIELNEGLVIPVSAVMPTGTRNIVFVDRGGGKLEPRRVLLGEECDDYYEVKSGVSEGERVVAGANFLIDAESKVQGALKDFEEPGDRP